MILCLILIPILAGVALWLLADKQTPASRIDCTGQDCIDCPVGPNCEHCRHLMGTDE